MRTIDRSTFRNAGGQISFSTRLQAVFKEGLGWQAEVQAQEDITRRLAKVFGDDYVLVRNCPMPTSHEPVPLILIGPIGVRVMMTTSLRGTYRAKAGQWMSLGGSGTFKSSHPTLASRLRLFEDAVRRFVTSKGINLPEGEPVLIVARPETYVENIKTSLRVVLADGVENFATSLMQLRPILSPAVVEDITRALGGPRSPGAEHARRDTGGDRVRGDVLRDDRPGADDGALAHGHARQQHRARPDIRPFAHAHGLDDEVGLDDRDVGRLAGVLAPQDLGARTPAHVLAELHVAAVEVRLRPDPGVRPDDAVAVVPALQVRLVAEEHRVADLERAWMQHQHSEADAHAVAEAPAHGPQQHAPLVRTLVAVAEEHAAVDLKELLRRARAPQLLALLDLLRRVRGDLADAVDGAHDPLRAVGRVGHRLANAFTASATYVTWSSVSSGYIGSERTSFARRSVTGSSPSR